MKKAPAKQGSRFYKLHGAGNDILVLEKLPKKNTADFVRQISHRQLGIGCDQLAEILSLKPLAIQIWNCDGSKTEMCANGSRTFLHLAAKEKWIDGKAKSVPLKVSGGQYSGLKVGTASYEFCLGSPEIGSKELLQVGSDQIPFIPVRTGNPHAVVLAIGGEESWKAPKDFSLHWYGPRIENHARFPQRTNVEFVRHLEVKGKEATVLVEVWERGAGATLSCGSGAVAVAAVVRRLTNAERVHIKMTDFTLQVRFEDERAYLSGPCVLVAKGEICF